MYILTKSETYNPDATAMGTDLFGLGLIGNPRHARDYVFETSYDYRGSVFDIPALTFDLQRNVRINSFWFKSSNLRNYEFLYSDNGSNFHAIGSSMVSPSSGINYQFNFSDETHRYWQIRFRTVFHSNLPIRINEVLLMRFLIEVPDNNRDRPLEYRRVIDDTSRDPYRLKDGRLIINKGLSNRGKSDFSLRFGYLRKSVKDQLKTVWLGPPKKPVLTVWPEPEDYPLRIFQARWDNAFNFNYSTSDKTQGFNGTIEFKEV